MKILTQLSLEVGGRKCIGAWKIHRQRQQAFINYLYLNEAATRLWVCQRACPQRCLRRL